MALKKYVYFFGEGKREMKKLLGGKGADLSEMTNMGLPVPYGFTITTEVCNLFYDLGKRYPEGLEDQIEENLKKLEEKMGMGFGDEKNPLLVSVRSGAVFSMPGMMDTVLNLGLNDKTVVSLIEKTKNERFGWDSYRRFVQMFGNVVMDVEHNKFEEALQSKKDKKNVKFDTELTAEDLRELVEDYKKIIKEAKGRSFPQDPREQLKMSIGAVFGSWNNKRAISYRNLHDLPHNLGTAVNVQAMVFGNMGQDSGTGVAFTRNPATGEDKFYGEYLMNAQGEDVVAGTRTPQHISKLEEEMPENYKQLMDIRKKLEEHYRDMQDVEFTIQEGKLYMLQTRTGKRTAAAALQVAVDMVDQGYIDKKTAVTRVEPQMLDQLLHKQLDKKAKKNAELLTRGLPASPGAALGKVVFDADTAVKEAKSENVILVRTETSPEDIQGMAVAQGILTARGGMTSHAAVVARGMGKCCVAGAEDIKVFEDKQYFEVNGSKVNKGDWVTLDGSTGEVFKGKIPVVDPEIGKNFKKFMSWVDDYKKIGVRANADTPNDAKVALNFGAEGIGLCRTEHMFFEADRIKAMRKMIVANSKEEREKALAKLLPIQKKDFMEIFKVMNDMPVTIRLLDPPLHEFLPHEDDDIREIAGELGLKFDELKATVNSLHEMNPMLGHRGCRLSITYPEILEMQVRAIFEATIELTKEGYKVKPEVMIPLVGDVKEVKVLKDQIIKIADGIMKKENLKFDYKVGTMIEVPRACVTADEIATEAEFFSFGTNDLTQMAYGFSRDDFGKFLPDYIEKGILEKDPFATLDRNGVGQLIKMGVEKGRKARENLKIGICGEHGGDPSSVEFCHMVGMDYVSCSPYRVPVARLAAAHAAIKGE
ncbi:MAG: pyruvate, phosphate dikinase [Actinobacteria bacterium]|nr:pyruvate, phosphate dikinase [Actinomycetota bacterium]MBL7123858.1 pyruvate, phosphate dikinase [Actinomycetota bacterium]